MSVMAHPSRADAVERLLPRLSLDPALVAWDRKNDRWDTGRRAWEMHDPHAEFHLVVQDDALVAKDLLAGVAKATEFLPQDAIASLYVGTRRPLAFKVEKAVQHARSLKPSWIVMPGLNWGVAILVPTSQIEQMLVWCDKQDYPNYDRRIGRYFVDVKRWHTWCTWPSLVDHSDGESLCGHGEGRKAHHFVGEDTSALGVDFSRPPIYLNAPHVRASEIIRDARRQKLLAEHKARRAHYRARIIGVQQSDSRGS